jgi:trans-aconitate methyltransferase
MDLKSETIETYNASAQALAEKFDTLGARTEDISFTFSHCHKENPFILEIGCGNGRDAREICKRTSNYTGIDISEKLIEIAKANLPSQRFEVADVENYVFPENVDIVFAFASLIHVPTDSLKNIMKQLYEKMNAGGLLFISLKHSPTYAQITKEDEFGRRTYWHYSEEDIRSLSSGFSIESLSIKNLRGQLWMDILFKKQLESLN